jgi:DNA-binding response OmpR family regulator
MPKVFAADVTKSVLDVIRLAFQDTEFDVYTSDDGVQALEMLMQIEPDVAVLGLSLPRRGGAEIATFLKCGERFRDVPVILLQDAFTRPDLGKLEGIEIDALIRKPFDSEELVRKVRELASAQGVPDELPEEPEPLTRPASNVVEREIPPSPDDRIQRIVRREIAGLGRELEKRLLARLKSGSPGNAEGANEGEE